jgi:hypothetical protein
MGEASLYVLVRRSFNRGSAFTGIQELHKAP